MSEITIKTSKINSLLVKSLVIFPFIEYIFSYSVLSPWKVNSPYLMGMFAFWIVKLSSQKITSGQGMWIPFGVYVFMNGLYGMASTYFLFVYATAVLSMMAIMRLNDNFIEYVIKSTIVISFIFALGCVFQKYFSGPYFTIAKYFFNSDGLEMVKNYDSYGIYAGFQYQPTAASAAIVIGIITMWSDIQRKKTLKFIMLIIMYYALFLTAKRMFFLLCAVVPVVVYYLKTSRNAVGKLKGVVVVSIIAIIAIVAYSYLSNSSDLIIFERLDEFGSGADAEELSNGRWDLMSGAWEIFTEHPIIGVGLGVFSKMYYGTSVHNVYLQLLAEMGIIGFMLFVIPAVIMLSKTIRLLRKKWQNYNDELAIKYSLGIQITFLLYSFTGNPLYNVQWIYVYFMACALALKVTGRKYKV